MAKREKKRLKKAKQEALDSEAAEETTPAVDKKMKAEKMDVDAEIKLEGGVGTPKSEKKTKKKRKMTSESFAADDSVGTADEAVSSSKKKKKDRHNDS